MEGVDDEALAALEREMLRHFRVLLLASDPTRDGPADGRESPGLRQERLVRAMGRLSAGMLRISQAREANWRCRLRDIRTSGILKSAAETDERMAVRSDGTLESGPESDEPIAAADPPKRRRGGQAGNRNALKHGRRSAAAKTRRAGLRLALGRARELAETASHLTLTRRKGPASTPGPEQAGAPVSYENPQSALESDERMTARPPQPRVAHLRDGSGVLAGNRPAERPATIGLHENPQKRVESDERMPARPLQPRAAHPRDASGDVAGTRPSDSAAAIRLQENPKVAAQTSERMALRAQLLRSAALRDAPLGFSPNWRAEALRPFVRMPFQK